MGSEPMVLEAPEPSFTSTSAPAGYKPENLRKEGRVKARRPAKPDPADKTGPDGTPTAAAPEADETDAENPGWFQRHRVAALVLGTCVVLLALADGYVSWDYASHFVSTDDAFIEARQFAIAPKVSGYIKEVLVTDNQHVDTGEVIARIDDRDYRTALEQAEAQVSAAAANIKNIDAQVAVQQAQIAASSAQLEQAQAALTFAEQQAARYRDLAQSGAGSVQNAQQYTSSLRQQQAGIKTAQESLTAAQRQIDALNAQRSSAEASLAQAKAQRDQAQLNLSYTTLTAAQPGRVVNLTAAVGEFVQPGANLSMFVPDDIWVTANFKETQLDEMRPGQPVNIHIDAYAKRAVSGKVASIEPGSGTAFSLLPPENATGNYVKVVQRVPVKILIEVAPHDVTLGPGMSVVPTVRVEPAPSLYEEMTSLWTSRPTAAVSRAENPVRFNPGSHS